MYYYNSVVYMYAMIIVSPSTCSQTLYKLPCSHLHAQGSRSTSDVNCGPEPSQCSPALTFSSFSVHADRVQCAVRVHVHDDHYLTHSKFNSFLTEMITPQTYKNIYIHIKSLPVSRVFGARSGSPRNIKFRDCTWQE